MIRSILVATDFSKTAEAGVRWATEVAKSNDAKIHILHAFRLPNVGTPYMPPPAKMVEALEQRVHDLLAEAARNAREAGVEVEIAFERGRPSDVIEAAAKSLPADLIVLGTQGQGAVEHLLLGSTAERVVPHAPCPVLAVHPDDQESRHPSRILVPSDFSDEALAAAEKAMELFSDAGGTLHVMHAYFLPIEYGAYGAVAASQDYLTQVATRSLEELKDWVKPLEGRGWEIRCEVAEGPATAAVLRATREHDIELIAMGTHGRSRIAELVLGSVAKKVLQHASCPVLTVPRRSI